MSTSLFFIYFFLIINCTYGSNCELETDIEKKCYKQYTENYNYRQYFPIEKSNRNDDILASVTFYVKADNNAHILLSPSNKRNDSDPAYEIVLGSANNTASEIRKGQKSKGGKAMLMKDAVTHNNWTGYWIRVNVDGCILVGKKGDDLPFLHWRDPQPLEINYYSFSSWENTVALWAHQCSEPETNLRSGFDDENSTNDEKNCQTFNTNIPDYFEFFPIDRSNATSNNSTIVKFSVKAESNAHILLSSTNQPSENDAAYEIVLGVANNTMSEIRRKQKANSKISIKMNDAVSQNVSKAYWIQVTVDGVVSVGREGETKDFMRWRDPQPLQINYYGFSSWDNVETSWEHQCFQATPQREERFFAGLDDNDTCQQFYTQNLNYTKFFPVEKPNNSSDISAEVIFYLRAGSNAHILLSPKKNPSKNDPGYEIVLGVGNNFTTEIRKSQKSEILAKTMISNLVSLNEWKGFWIRLDTEGLLTVGRKGNDWPFIAWRDPAEPLQINYYSFSSDPRLDAVWKHQCSQTQTSQTGPKEIESRSVDNDEKSCKNYYSRVPYYTEFFPIDKSPTSKYVSPILRFYVKAESNAHVLLSPTYALKETDPVYEIVLGVANNTMSEIRRKQKADSKVSIKMTKAVSRNSWKGYWIQIGDKGLIQIGQEGEDKPFLEWLDKQPLPIKYYSFSSWDNVETYWQHQCTSTSSTSDNSKENSQVLERILFDIDHDQTCQNVHTKDARYNEFFPVEKTNNSSGILISMTFYVKAQSNAHIFLSSKSNPQINEPGYEIVLGGANNTISEIRRGQKTENKASILLPNIVSSTEWRGYWIRIHVGGLIEVGREGDVFPILYWKDLQPLRINYYSFSSWPNVDAYWEHQCSQANNQPLGRINKDDVDHVDHVDDENCQRSFTYDYNHSPFFPIEKSNQSGEVTVQFRVKADSNAHVLLSPKENPTDKEVYEIVLGSANNIASEIRKARRTENKQMKYMKDVVTEDQWKSYWIKIDSRGLIMVGVEGEELPFLHWRDPQPWQIKYYSFSSWYNTSASWMHHCSRTNDKLQQDANKTCKILFTENYDYNFPLLPIENTNSNGSIKVNLTFDVKTSNNTFVILSPTLKPTDKEPVYEIVLGTVSEIRRKRKTDSKASVQMIDEISNTWESYWIRVDNSGSILVGKKGDDLPFLRWKDPKPLILKYYGFSSEDGGIAIWKYQCEQPEIQSVTNSKPSDTKPSNRNGRITPRIG